MYGRRLPSLRRNLWTNSSIPSSVLRGQNIHRRPTANKLRPIKLGWCCFQRISYCMVLLWYLFDSTWRLFYFLFFYFFIFFYFLQTEWKHPAQGYDSIFLHQYPWNRNLFVLVNSIQSSMRFPLKCYLELNTHSLKVSFPQIKPSISVLNSTFWNLNLINFSVQLFPFTLDSILFN